ncbi:tyrosine-type recombinase/integrase [Stratiformator vulcanicus]|uniref:tyrosine-type recombinase/integrase n=1 Tax=Stratiformator vulcanicus TaxID=2527980 RepID=UPI002877258E|nr:tyrosine-type recombinase/integrase [Stratiformator vulcanicus]
MPALVKPNVKLVKPTGSDTYCFRPTEVKSILEYCRNNEKLIWIYQLIAVLASTGMRIGEAQSLRWTDIALNTQSLTVPDERASHRKRRLGSARTAKGKRGRSVPLGSNTIQILSELDRHQDGYVFHGPLGGRLKPDTVRNILVRDVLTMLKSRFPTLPGDIGFEHGRLHSFRHYFVSQAFAHGASEGQVKDWVGHRDSEMVACYRHQFDDANRQRIDQIPFI